MKTNYEIKCRVNDFDKIREVIKSIKGISKTFEKQSDIYFKVKKGRLKLRIINDTTGNLICYFRDERAGKKISKYMISRTNDVNELERILKMQFGILVKVKKKREIYIFDNVRIHLDTVSKLGKFIEIEIIYKNFSEAKVIMSELIQKLGLKEQFLIKESYSDLINKRK